MALFCLGFPSPAAIWPLLDSLPSELDTRWPSLNGSSFNFTAQCLFPTLNKTTARYVPLMHGRKRIVSSAR